MSNIKSPEANSFKNGNEREYENCSLAKSFIPVVYYIIVVSLILLCISLYINCTYTILVLSNILTAVHCFSLVFSSFLFKKGLFLKSVEDQYFRTGGRGEIVDKYLVEILNKIDMEGVEYNSRDFPIYTVLLPIYKEVALIKKLLFNIEKLHYPKDRLQVFLVLEIFDIEALNTINSMCMPSYVQVIVVPDFFPYTKAKACNYALQYCSGEYVTIFDAEDDPDPKQLLIALACMKYNPNVGCVQANLSYYNANENLLSKMFTIEYAILYDYLLPAMYYYNMAIPLGGSSNHIRFSTLRALGGWDAYNVTEDADLGLRLAFYGMKVVMIKSHTYEESPITIRAWLRQRTRWIKGHILTGFIYMWSVKGLGGVKSWINIVLKMVFKPLAACFFLQSLICMFLSYVDILEFPYVWGCVTIGFSTISALLSYIISLYTAKMVVLYTTFSCKIKEWWFFPFYITLYGVASITAVVQLVVAPYYWNKTTHGVGKSHKAGGM